MEWHEAVMELEEINYLRNSCAMWRTDLTVFHMAFGPTEFLIDQKYDIFDGVGYTWLALAAFFEGQSYMVGVEFLVQGGLNLGFPDKRLLEWTSAPLIIDGAFVPGEHPLTFPDGQVTKLIIA